MILTRTSLRKIALTLMMSVAVLGFASPASAQVTLYKTDFENPPFTPGNLVGQDGWVHHSGSGTFIPVIGGQAGQAFKQTTEERRVVVTYFGADLVHWHIAGFQQGFGLLDPQVLQVIDE